MQVPMQIVLKGVPDAAATRALVQEAALAIERYYDRVTSCHVAVANPDARHRKGGQYEVHVSMLLPGNKEINVSRHSNGQLEGEHLRVALRQAFAQARRQLQDVVRKLRGDTKTSRAATRRTRAVKTKEA